MDLKEIGARIKRCRQEQDLTQEKFAELINASPHYVYEIERGIKTMSLSTLDRISTCLNISTDYLLYGYNNSSTSDNDTYSDNLALLINTLSPAKRANLFNILENLLPYLKQKKVYSAYAEYTFTSDRKPFS